MNRPRLTKTVPETPPPRIAAGEDLLERMACTEAAGGDDGCCDWLRLADECCRGNRRRDQ